MTKKDFDAALLLLRKSIVAPYIVFNLLVSGSYLLYNALGQKQSEWLTVERKYTKIEVKPMGYNKYTGGSREVETEYRVVQFTDGSLLKQESSLPNFAFKKGDRVRINYCYNYNQPLHIEVQRDGRRIGDFATGIYHYFYFPLFCILNVVICLLCIVYNSAFTQLLLGSMTMYFTLYLIIWLL